MSSSSFQSAFLRLKYLKICVVSATSTLLHTRSNWALHLDLAPSYVAPNDGRKNRYLTHSTYRIDVNKGRRVYVGHGLCWIYVDHCELAHLNADFWGAERPQ